MCSRLLVAMTVLLSASCVPAYGYVSVDYVPDDYAVYPHTYYAGEPVYLIDGRWYARQHSHWVYFRSEPPELFHYRQRVGPAARAYPRPYRYETQRRSAPPARISAPPARRSAPPARVSAPPARRGAPPARRRAPPAHGER
jgi:hypothetical protein